MRDSTTGPSATALHVELDPLPAFVQRLATRQVAVEDPVYHRRKQFEGYGLVELLTAAGVPLPVEKEDHRQLVFICADGYRPSLELKAILQISGVLAYRDLAAGGAAWEPFRQGRETVTPAPFYLVWERPAFGDGTKPPWPYRIVAIEVSSSTGAAPDVLARADRDAQAGADLFRRNCQACHAMNLAGGTLGPELNVPANVTEYWHPEALRRYIKDPGALRVGSKMPASPDLSDEDVERLVAYLTFMRSQKIRTSR